VERATLLVSELVTNSVLHGELRPSDQIEVKLHLNGRLRVEVLDPGGSFTPGRSNADEVGGWGLVVVEQLADRWGVVRNDATCVWFELAVAPSSAGHAGGDQEVVSP
jgi:anti-sigma regulatory factor (Ser/Thr protein kinase)